MKTKEADVLYCGVNEEKVKSAKPVLCEEVLEYHHAYITERHRIYKRKEIEKLPQDQWTEDEVFKNYRFTNVRRELDRESKWLIKHVSENPDLTLEQKVLNSILFRTYNKSSTLQLIDFPLTDFEGIDPAKYRAIFEEYAKENPKYVFFTPAFNTGGLKFANAFPERIKDKAYLNQPSLGAVVIYPDGKEVDMVYKEARDLVAEDPTLTIKGWEGNIPTRMIHMIKYIYDTGLHHEILEAETQEDAFNSLLKIHGFSGFLAYQVFVDLTYIPEYKFSENEFTISGPGCDRGIDLMFDDKDGMTSEEALFWIRDNIEKEWDKRDMHVDFDELFDHLPEYDRCLNVMMLENSYCELSKYTKARRGTGRPRNRYVPTEEPETCDNECSIEEWM